MKLHLALAAAFLGVIATLVFDWLAPAEWFGDEETRGPNDLHLFIIVVFWLSAWTYMVLVVAELVRWLKRLLFRRQASHNEAADA